MRNWKENVNEKCYTVVFAMDDLFAEPGYVAIWSMLENSCKEKNHEISILHSECRRVKAMGLYQGKRKRCMVGIC